MNTPAGRAVRVAAVLGGVVGCLDFEREHEAFCRRNLELCGGANVRPEFVSASQSPYSRGGEPVSLRVDARDIYGLGLRFKWDPGPGTYSGQQDSEVSSGILWTAPACVAANVTPTVTVEVTHAGGGSASMSFHIAGVETCPSWSETRGMRVARYGHTAALLPSGRVRVTGGYGVGGSEPRGAEEYDPALRRWLDTPEQGLPEPGPGGTQAPWPPALPMEWVRSGYTATTLPTGQVLVAGGWGHRRQEETRDAVLSSAEVYDSGAGTWSVACGVQKPQEARTLTVLPSNQVLVTGGYGTAPSSGAQLYDPSRGTCLESSGMAIPRRGHTATMLPSGRVLVAGGANVSPEVYSSVTDTWTLAAGMSLAREGHTATLLPTDEVLLVGGRGSKGLLVTAELYDFKSNQWSLGGSISRARVDHTATLVLRDGVAKVLVVGGHGADGRPLAAAELYDPKSHRWSSTGSLKQARARHSATLLPSGQVLVVGGQSGTAEPLATAELYDPETGEWSSASPLGQARTGHTATLLPTNQVLVVGGQSTGGVPAGSELYGVVSGQWAAAHRPVMPRSGHLAGVLPSGRVLITGGTGLGTDAPEVPEWEVYSP